MKNYFIIFVLLFFITLVEGEDEYSRYLRSYNRRSTSINFPEQKAENYLQKDDFNLPVDVIDNSADDFNAEKGNVNTFFQQFESEAIGEAYDGTKIEMTRPWVIKHKRSAKEIPFPNKLIYYTFVNYSPDLHPSEIRQTIRQAFDIWSAVIPRDFSEVSSHDKFAQILIKFVRGPHRDDPYPFDGKGNVLAHATPGGYVHFDGDEKWKIHRPGEKFDYSKTDLLSVAIHEIGHSLGLRWHLTNRDSIMQESNQIYVDEKDNYIFPELSTSDIFEIQKIYGPRLKDNRYVPQPPPPPPRPPQRQYFPPTPFPPQRFLPQPPYQPPPPRKQPAVIWLPYQQPQHAPLLPQPPRKQSTPKPRWTPLSPTTSSSPQSTATPTCPTLFFCNKNIPENNIALNFFQQIYAPYVLWLIFSDHCNYEPMNSTVLPPPSYDNNVTCPQGLYVNGYNVYHTGNTIVTCPNSCGLIQFNTTFNQNAVNFAYYGCDPGLSKNFSQRF